MDCLNAEFMVSAYINKTLSIKDMEKFLLHIEKCPSCYDELETYFTVMEASRQLNVENMTLDFKELLRQDIKKSWKMIYIEKLKKSIRILLGFLAVAALAAFLLLLLYEIRG